MKRSLFSVAIVAVALLFASCGQEKKQTITLDLSQSTTPATVEYDANGIWNGTYDKTVPYIVSQVYSFQHFADESEYAGNMYPYYMGFTISKNDQATTYPAESAAAKGAVAGAGKPYMVCYWGDYYYNGVRYRTADIRFDGAYTPKQVYVNNVASAVAAIKEGDDYARAFAAGDYFTLTFQALNEKYEVIAGQEVKYYLADFRDGKSFINQTWEKVDLSALGECYGITFDMETTDVVTYGTETYFNTPTYFALDGLTVTKNVAK